MSIRRSHVKVEALWRSAPWVFATPSCSAVKIIFESFFHAALKVGDSFLLLCSLFYHPEKQLQHFCLSSSKSPLSAPFFPCLPAPGSFPELPAPGFAPCQHIACLRFLSSSSQAYYSIKTQQEICWIIANSLGQKLCLPIQQWDTMHIDCGWEKIKMNTFILITCVLTHY